MLQKNFLKVTLFLGVVLIIGGAGCTQRGSEVPIRDNFGDTSPSEKTYVSKDSKQCETLRFRCEEGEVAFSDTTGCGCQKEIKDTPQFCTEEYKPVCGEIEVQCIKAPCPPLKQTFGNRCLADQAKAKNITEGECKEVISTFLEISEPVNGKSITSPLAVKGRVLSPWLFEGVAPIEVQDSKGTVLGKGTIKGPSDWMTRNGWMNFETTITFSKSSTTEGFVIFNKSNASGKPELDQQIKIPVKFNQGLAICPTIYKPVCGEIQPKCITEPCLPLRQTYSNRCTAEAAGAQKIIEGECKVDPRASVQINSPKEGSLVISPLLIKGQAKGTWFFEGSFPIEIITKDGKSVSKGVAQAQGDWMTENMVNFEANITFQKPTATEGFIVFRKNNPSGNPALNQELKWAVKFSQEVAVTCQVSGCNKEICSDKNETSICIARPEYACYKTAACKAQADGKCGWSETPELKKCLEQARKIP